MTTSDLNETGMKEKTLSVIIPTFNMERFLRRCLDSIIASGMEDDIDAIVVNDGGTDSSLAIAREYELAHPGCIRVVDKPNRQYGSCVNIGLSMAAGSYVTVLDADDSFDSEGLRSLVTALREASEDAVLHDMRMVDMKGNGLCTFSCPLEAGKTYGVEALCSVPELWGHMVVYRTETLRKAAYHQTEGIYYTDQEWIFYPVTAVNTLRYFPWTVYDYTVGRMGQSIDPDVFWKHIGDEITGLKSQLTQYSQMGSVRDEVRKYLLIRLRTRLSSVYSQLLIYHLDEESVRKAIEFDSWLHGISEELWEMAAALEAPVSGLHICYVRSWRRNGCRPELTCRLLHVYKRLRQLIVGRR